MERETGLEPVTSSLGNHAFIESKSLACFCCEFLNLQRLAESVFFKSVGPIEAQMRQGCTQGRNVPCDRATEIQRNLANWHACQILSLWTILKLSEECSAHHWLAYK